MDMQLPITDGYTATTQLRMAGYKAPIIAITGNSQQEDREKCLKSGCSDYINKPFDHDDLFKIILKHTENVMFHKKAAQFLKAAIL